MKRPLLSAPTVRALVLGCAVLAATSSIASAQRGGGGGGGGGRGGGRGGGGGGFGASQQSPMQRVREQLKESDQLEFLDKKEKQLELTKEQKESLKTLRKDMQETEKPLFKDLEKIFSEQERGASQGGGGGGGGGGARGGSAGGDDQGSGASRGGRGMPPGVREAMLKLTEIQDAAGERAHALLNENQKHMSDSLLVIYKAELRDKETKRSRPGGFGRG